MEQGKKGETRPGTKRRWPFAVLIIGVVALLFIPFIPVRETYRELEPYDRPATYEVQSATLTQGWDLSRGVYHVFKVVLKNTDKYGGTFTVELKLFDVNGLYGHETRSGYAAPGGTLTLAAEFDTKIGQDVRGEYTVTAPTVTDQQLVTKERTVYRSIVEILAYGGRA